MESGNTEKDNERSRNFEMRSVGSFLAGIFSQLMMWCRSSLRMQGPGKRVH